MRVLNWMNSKDKSNSVTQLLSSSMWASEAEWNALVEEGLFLREVRSKRAFEEGRVIGKGERETRQAFTPLSLKGKKEIVLLGMGWGGSHGWAQETLEYQMEVSDPAALASF